ncbi:hypothetical protein PUNSTDRAFT_136879 [Punctularia strigosozonata HHB-11173 SS5]|uniref:uncharacterized protein n=1 Tax=Punctularia strigosozonata (strain HHB-11173) TaxID=741275 RepID=UPI000441769C|nr:uncharacterized protein PUNSTDRAFT_136879 [Punctularia strigosozonata HHB-11173 SS5]EIN06084.1 hypothetical protein PUNSTDRAFT_136879 [Punctularia strigosozonata HHB-11173 SS5]
MGLSHKHNRPTLQTGINERVVDPEPTTFHIITIVFSEVPSPTSLSSTTSTFVDVAPVTSPPSPALFTYSSTSSTPVGIAPVTPSEDFTFGPAASATTDAAASAHDSSAATATAPMSTTTQSFAVPSAPFMPTIIPLATSTGSASKEQTIGEGRILGGVAGGLIIMLVVFVIFLKMYYQRRTRKLFEKPPGCTEDGSDTVSPYPLPLPATSGHINRTSRKLRAFATPIRSLTRGYSAMQTSPFKMPSAEKIRETDNPEPLVVFNPTAEKIRETENPEPLVVSNPAAITQRSSLSQPDGGTQNPAQ